MPWGYCKMVAEKKTKTVSVRAYEFFTPKFAGNRQLDKVYDHEVIDVLFKSIIKLNKSERMYKNSSFTINLGKYSPSMNSDIFEGHFLTTSHGVERKQIDIDTQEDVGVIPPEHGIENEVYFAIDKKSGLLLVAEDINRAFGIQLLKSLLYRHKELIYPYIEEYNSLNKKEKDKFFAIHKNVSYKLTTLPPIDFFKKLEDFSKIKKATLFLDKDTDKTKIDVSEALDRELLANEIENYGLEIKIINESPKGMIKVFGDYFKRAIELEKYDAFSIEGTLPNGKTRTITPETLTKEFFIPNVEIKPNGRFSDTDIFGGLRDIIQRDSPIVGKASTSEAKSVGDCYHVEKSIQALIDERNKTSNNQTRKEG